MFYLALMFIGSFARAEMPEVSNQSHHFQELWNDYAASVQVHPLQKGCHPRLMQASGKVPFRGTVLLYHGFTACPDQYEEWGDHDLTQAGFDVVLPVLPGHGREWTGKDHQENDLSGMPNRKNWLKVYSQFVGQMNQLMKESAGEKIIGGLSVGAEVAIAGMLADPGLYARGILLSPFFRYAIPKEGMIKTKLNSLKPGFVDWISNPSNPFNWVSKTPQSWGKNCEVLERNLGRQGYCHFTLENVSANQYLGSFLVNRFVRVPALPPIQFVAVENDPVASTDVMRVLFNRANRAAHGQSQMCFIQGGANHSLLSRHDSPKENKFWLNGLLKQITRFVVEAKPIDSKGHIKTEADFPACVL